MKMMRSALIAAGLLTVTATPALAQPSNTYRATGTEPFWSLIIDGRTMRYEAPGARPLIVPAPKPRPSFNGRRYITRQMTVDITRAPCSDGMSDRRYPDRVTVTIGRRTLTGCGGAPAGEQASLIDGDWRVTRIAGQPVRGRVPLTTSFHGDRITGNGGCNSFSGPVRFERGRLNAGPLVSTRRACANPVLMRQETTLLNLLGQRLTVTSARGRLVLTTRDGRALTLERTRGPR